MQSKPSNSCHEEAGSIFSTEAFLHLELDFSTFKVWFPAFRTIYHKTESITVNFPVFTLEQSKRQKDVTV